MFFNGRQHRVRHGIVTAIDRYGPPEIVSDGNALRVRVAGPSEGQCLFAVEREGKVSRPVGLILYVRDSFERITVLHLVVAEAYAVGGPRSKYNLLLRLVQAVSASRAAPRHPPRRARLLPEPTARRLRLNF